MCSTRSSTWSARLRRRREHDERAGRVPRRGALARRPCVGREAGSRSAPCRGVSDGSPARDHGRRHRACRGRRRRGGGAHGFHGSAQTYVDQRSRLSRRRTAPQAGRPAWRCRHLRGRPRSFLEEAARWRRLRAVDVEARLPARRHRHLPSRPAGDCCGAAMARPDPQARALGGARKADRSAPRDGGPGTPRRPSSEPRSLQALAHSCLRLVCSRLPAPSFPSNSARSVPISSVML